MTSKLTREERVQSLYDLKIGQVLNQGDIENIKMLARMALAAMDSEPVAYMYDGEDGREYNGHNEFSSGGKGIPLYLHAQPAPEKYNIGDATMRHIFTPTGMTNVSDMQAVFDRVEAVLVGMEQPASVVPKSISVREAISALESADAVTTIGQAYKMGWNACRAAMLSGGKS